MASKLRDYVIYYKKKMERNTDEDIILNSIHKLAKIPMTYELLQETGIGKAIRNYSKDSGKIGEKARVVYHKWKNVVAESVPTSTKVPTAKSDSKKVHSSKDKTKIHNKAPLSEIDSLSNNSKKTSTNCVSIDVNDLNQKYTLNDTSDESLYTYEKPEGACEYVDYDPHCNINLGYSPDHPELYPESHNNSSKKECVEKSKHTLYSQKSISHHSSKKHKSETVSEKSNGHISKSKKARTDEMQLTTSESNPYKNGLDSKTLKAKKDVKKEKDKKQSPDPVELKRTKHETKEKSNSEKIKSSADSKQKKSESKHVSPNNSTNKLHKKAEKSKSKSKLNLKVKEEFTSSEVSFEDCLGFNDMISVRKKKICSKSTKKEKKTESDAVPTKINRNRSLEVKKNPLVIEKAPVENSYRVPDIASTLPQIQPNYRPLVHKSPEFTPVKKKVLTNEDAIKFTSSKKEKTAVYSGRRNHTITEVPTLFNACIEVLIDNIDAIECLGGTPYFLVKPVMERCTPNQLLNIENFNPSFLDETQDLWEAHCRRDCRNAEPDENETWRDLYWRVKDETEKRLKSVTANISASMSKSAPTVRKAKLAYVDSVAKPPRDVARRQAKHGTALPVNTPMKAAPPSKATPRPTAPAINAAASTSGAGALKKNKLAPLMAKTLKSLKCYRR
ncbi:transcription elongation factor B polypeptide 3-like [Uloborus diversus]|uniref:transcription elongation factor B polypeptide 3-like n=1 Tax=Uloborus diversus TaxID=327109 RepID=UPI00240983BA|nr:transcription elongation factor B polypeptide 3-like [Uloborus diversus]XP_054708707.1 transcription elongation factor B polypeptide 3-like [Uloborus diversus]